MSGISIDTILSIVNFFMGIFRGLLNNGLLEGLL